MENIKKVLCDKMYDFMLEHESEINTSFKLLGFKSRDEFFEKIRTSYEDAGWCLTELCAWGLAKNYLKSEFTYKVCDDVTIYKIDDRYFKMVPIRFEPIEMVRSIEMVEVERFNEM